MKNKHALLICPLLALTSCAATTAPSAKPVVWELKSLDIIGGQKPEVLGAPKAAMASGHRALCFDGKADGVFVPVNPIEGWGAYTVEALFKPDGDGPEEQRFLHIQDESNRRLLLETRVANNEWALDTFLLDTEADKLALLDRTLTSPTDQWHWAALVFDGKKMTHYVNGVKQLEGAVKVPPMGSGRISLGVRQNLVYWYKGCIAQVRFTPSALDAKALQIKR